MLSSPDEIRKDYVVNFGKAARAVPKADEFREHRRYGVYGPDYLSNVSAMLARARVALAKLTPIETGTWILALLWPGGGGGL